MNDISSKKITLRTATAKAEVILGKDIIKKIKNKKIPKGDVIETSRIVGIQAAKEVPRIFPHCHNIALDNVSLDFKVETEKITVFASAKASAKTGVEMEALTACSAAALNIYDMCKMFGKSIKITEIELVKKTGGKSGDYFKK
jgi:cyclic pyranopterin phosphate synthase